MLEFLAGIGAGLLIAIALGVWRGKRHRRQMRLFAEFQRAVFDVQDQAAFSHMYRAGSERVERDRIEVWQGKKAARDQALAAYLAAMGE